MKSQDLKERSLSFQQKVFLLVVFPALLLFSAEIVSSFALKFFSKNPAPIDLDMPAWLRVDANFTSNDMKRAAGENDWEWLSIFESGDGFRVRIIPLLERKVKNTFSLSAYDKENGYNIKSNSLGFRGPEPLSHGESIELSVFGDSSSFGWGVEEKDRYDTLLTSSLSSKLGKPVRNLNFAIPGDSSEYGSLVFDKFYRNYPAKLVILGFGANDGKLATVSHSSQVEKFKNAKSIQKLNSFFEKSSLYTLLKKLLRSPVRSSSAQTPKHHAVSRKRFAQNLTTMILSAKKLGSEVLVLSVCSPAEYSKTAREAAKRNGALYLNGQQLLLDSIPAIKNHQIEPALVQEIEQNNLAELKSSPLFYITSDFCHPNRLGHKLISQAIIDKTALLF